MKQYVLVSMEKLRIDKFISDNIEELSRSYAQKLIKDGFVTVCDKCVDSNYKLKSGEEVKVSIPEPEVLQTVAQDIPLDVVYEDDYLIVINKPQGMVVHPAAGNFEGTLVNALLSHCKDGLSEINGVLRPGIVHRIDKNTSGLLVCAKNNEAHISLSEQIKEHSVTRRYVAIVHGGIREDDGTIDAPIGRNTNDRKKMCITTKNSKNAVTHYKVLERFGKYTYIECRLETGRTHQIRVHMSSRGNPVVGDKEYGIKKEKFSLEGQLLHARILGFIHPKTNEYMEFEAPIPEHFEKVLRYLRETN